MKYEKSKNYILFLKKKIPLFESNPRLATFSSISVAVFVLGFVLFSFVYSFSDTKIVKAENVVWTPPVGKSIMEVHLANNGLVYIQGARIESISGTIIEISTSWNTVKLKWTIYTNGSSYGKRRFGTSFLDSNGKELTIKDLRVGGIISVNGVFDLTQAGPTVKAEVIRISL